MASRLWLRGARWPQLLVGWHAERLARLWCVLAGERRAAFALRCAQWVDPPFVWG